MRGRMKRKYYNSAAIAKLVETRDGIEDEIQQNILD